jgi:diacylglycerol kinase (ATP)
MAHLANPPDNAPRVRVIVNPHAGQKSLLPTSSYRVEEVETCLQNAGIAYELVIPETAGGTAIAARDTVAEGYALVVAAGGDGTLAAVARELIGSETALGVLPMGTMMNIARMLDIPRDLPAAAMLLASGEPRYIDVGEVNGIYFFEAVSIGLNANLLEAADRFDHGQIEPLVQALARIKRSQPARIKLTIDGREILTEAMVVTIHNGPYIGAAFNVAPMAVLDDRVLDVIVFPHFSKWELLRYFASISFGRSRYHPRVMRLTGKHIQVESDLPLPVRADMLDVGTTPVDLWAVPRALKVIVGPAAFRPERVRSIEDFAAR